MLVGAWHGSRSGVATGHGMGVRHAPREETSHNLREMVTAVLVVLRLEEGEPTREKTRCKTDAIL